MRYGPQRNSEATLFYLLIAAGGVAGSFFIGVASPLLFNANYDIAISFTVTAAAAMVVIWNGSRMSLQAKARSESPARESFCPLPPTPALVNGHRFDVRLTLHDEPFLHS